MRLIRNNRNRIVRKACCVKQLMVERHGSSLERWPARAPAPVRCAWRGGPTGVPCPRPRGCGAVGMRGCRNSGGREAWFAGDARVAPAGFGWYPTVASASSPCTAHTTVAPCRGQACLTCGAVRVGNATAGCRALRCGWARHASLLHSYRAGNDTPTVVGRRSRWLLRRRRCPCRGQACLTLRVRGA